MKVRGRSPLVVRVVLGSSYRRATHGLLLRSRDALLVVERKRVEVWHGSARHQRRNVLLAALTLWQYERAGAHGRRKVCIDRLLFSRRLKNGGAAWCHLGLAGYIRRHTARPIPLLKEHLATGVAADELCRVRDLLLTERRWRADWHRHGHALLVATLEHLRGRKLLSHLFLLMCMNHLHLLLQHHLLVLHGQLLLQWSGRFGPLPVATR